MYICQLPVHTLCVVAVTHSRQQTAYLGLVIHPQLRHRLSWQAPCPALVHGCIHPRLPKQLVKKCTILAEKKWVHGSQVTQTHVHVHVHRVVATHVERWNWKNLDHKLCPTTFPPQKKFELKLQNKIWHPTSNHLTQTYSAFLHTLAERLQSLYHFEGLHTHIHTRACTDTHTSTRMHTHTHIHTSVCTHKVHACTHNTQSMCMCTRAHTNACARAHTHKHTHIQACAHTQVHTKCKHARTHAHTQTHTHTHKHTRHKLLKFHTNILFVVNPSNMKCNLIYVRTLCILCSKCSPPQLYETSQLMMYTVKVAVCS